MKKRSDKELSKYLSLILRHQPTVIGLQLDEAGWGEVAYILSKIEELSMERLEAIVKEDNKQRYSFNEDKTKIRANQGHSVAVDLQLKAQTPPPVLYHGTPSRNEAAILRDGLHKMQRQHVHLSADFETARNVAARRKDQSAILRIRAQEMAAQGHDFFCSENGVWLVDYVPPAFIEVVGYYERITPEQGSTRAEEFAQRKNT